MKWLFIFFIFHITVNAEDDFFENDNQAQMSQKHYYDPFEIINRISFKAMKVGTNFVKPPIAKMYDYAVPSMLHPHIRNISQNASEPVNALTALLLPHKSISFHSVSRFIFNTIFGIAGFFDLHAQYSGKQEYIGLDDVAQYYYKKPLPYLVLPMGFGNIFSLANWYQTGEFYDIFRDNGYANQMISLTFANIISATHANMDIISDALNHSIDPYPVMRNAYYQLQKGQIQRISTKESHPKYIQLISSEFN